MALISLQQVSLAFGGPLLFDKMSLQIESSQRVALLGRNGVGKSTLLKVLAGLVSVDSGERVLQKGLKVSYLPQEFSSDIAGSVEDVICQGLDARADCLREYHHVNAELQKSTTPELLKRLDRIQHQMDDLDCWTTQKDVDAFLDRLQLTGQTDFQALSGGQKRRVLIAKAMIQAPDVLLLDEPTNHLDIAAIDDLENLIRQFEGSLVFITHDRMFMQSIATRIIELDRGRLLSWETDYQIFLERKQKALEAEAAQQAEFDKKLAQEEIWIRKGIKARRTRNEGRVRALKEMRQQRLERRDSIGQVRMSMGEADRSGQIVIKAQQLSFAYDDVAIVKNFSTQILRGDKIGLIGANGSGKSTLLRLLLGELQPHSGTVKLGQNLRISYFDQMREFLDENKTVIENITDNTETIQINGKSRHVMGYLQDFLFSPERARTPVRVLSGGERNRLLLARHFTKPANVLIMDEPTNDLDIETLELLEELLVQYKGTLLLVSHDRAFLNNVVTSTMVMNGLGDVNEYPGGYDDWLAQRQPVKVEMSSKAKIEDHVPVSKQSDQLKKPTGSSYQQQKEFAAVTRKIEKLEAKQASLTIELSDPNLYQTRPEQFNHLNEQLSGLACELDALYKRWEELAG